MSGDNPNSFLCPNVNKLPARIQKTGYKKDEGTYGILPPSDMVITA